MPQVGLWHDGGLLFDSSGQDLGHHNSSDTNQVVIDHWQSPWPVANIGGFTGVTEKSWSDFVRPRPTQQTDFGDTSEGLFSKDK